MKFLGLRLDAHDSNISYSDNDVVKYFKPERLYQKKHFGYNNFVDWIYPAYLLNYKLKDLDAVCIVADAFNWPFLNESQNLFELVNIPVGPLKDLKCPIFRIDHHYAHALSSWMLTDTTNHVVLDGFGDAEKSVSFFYENKNIKSFEREQIKSFGNFMEIMGKNFNLQGHSEDLAGKIMALQSFGIEDSKWWEKIKNKPYEENSFVFDLRNYAKMYGSDTIAKLNLLNYLKTTHKYVELKIPEFFDKYLNTEDTITYSGGVAHNICVNTKLKEKYKKLIIPPHCADEGLSLGCIEFLRQYYEQPKFSVEGFPFWQNDVAPKNKASDKTIKQTAEDLANGKIIGWYQGHGEIGPRALGNRSILMSPEIKNGKSILNEKVKHREDFRPFAASIKEDKTSDYFNWIGKSEFMKFSVSFKDKIFEPISHIDNTSRIQTVDKNHTLFYQLLDEFEKLTGLPMLLNTSLNDNGKPIAGEPADAISLLKNSYLDKLIIGNTIAKYE